jgi:transposase InsO family protein
MGAVLSMSRAGRPWENGQCESFLKTLKQEEIDARPYHTMEELEQHVGEFIEQTYNQAYVDGKAQTGTHGRLFTHASH